MPRLPPLSLLSILPCILTGLLGFQPGCGTDQLNRVSDELAPPGPEIGPDPAAVPLPGPVAASPSRVAFESNQVTVLEDVGGQGATLRLRRTGEDLSVPAFVSIAITGGTAAANTNYLPLGFAFGSTGLARRVEFPATSGTAQLAEVSLVVLDVDGRNGDQTVTFELSEPDSLVEFAAPSTVALTIVDTDLPPPPPDGDTDFQGRPIPDYEPMGRYLGIGACEFPGFPPMPGPGGHAPCGSWEIAPQACSAGMTGEHAITKANMFVLEDLVEGNSHFGNDLRFGLAPHQAFVLKFRTGGEGSYQQLAGLPSNALGALQFAFASQVSRGSEAVRFATLSTSPCDFDQEPGHEYEKLDSGDPCYKRIQGYVGVIYAQVVSSGEAEASRCTLQPNTTYYLNMRWEDPSDDKRHENSCVASDILGTCGTSLAIH